MNKSFLLIFNVHAKMFDDRIINSETAFYSVLVADSPIFYIALIFSLFIHLICLLWITFIGYTCIVSHLVKSCSCCYAYE